MRRTQTARRMIQGFVLAVSVGLLLLFASSAPAQNYSPATARGANLGAREYIPQHGYFGYNPYYAGTQAYYGPMYQSGVVRKPLRYQPAYPLYRYSYFFRWR